MPKVNAPLYSLNGGEVGKEGLARLDLARLQFAGSLYSNIIPRKAGPMTIRPGLEYVRSFNPTGKVSFLSYPFSDKDTVIPVLSSGEMRVLLNDEFVSRVAVSTTIQNGDFTSLTGWTDASTNGASISIDTNRLKLEGAQFGRASAKQTITVAAGDAGNEHALLIKIDRGPVTFRLGTADTQTDLLPSGREVVLDDGTHSIAFTPTVAGDIFLEIYHEEPRDLFVDSCQISGAGEVVIPTPWNDGDFENIRYRDSLDILFVSSLLYQQREVQRRGNRSWGLQRYKVDNGPFTPYVGKIEMKPSDYRGSINLQTNQSYFNPNMVGRLFRIFSSGQAVEETFNAPDQRGDYIRISGVGDSRTFSYTATGAEATAVLVLQSSIDDGSGTPSGWNNVGPYTGDGTYTDPDDNVIKYFRWVTRSGVPLTGTVTATLNYSGGGQSGVARMTGYVSTTQVQAEVLSRFYGLAFTTSWDYSVWSDDDGWPSAVELWGGRLYWFKGNNADGSVPDGFKNFSDEIEGDSAPIQRSLGTGGQRGTLWGMALQRLIAGTDSAEVSIRSSSFDEPLTAGNWFPIEASTRGCANVQALKANSDGFFVQASGTKVYRLTWDAAEQDYVSDDMMELHEDLTGGSQIVGMTVQRNPDTIFWFWLADGTARALTYEKRQNVVAWSRVVTDGQIEAVTAVRGSGRDTVYFYVNRNGDRRIEKLAGFDECKGGPINCVADSFTRFTLSAPETTFSVPHLDGRQVVVWADGKAVHDQDNLYTVASGQVVLTTAATQGVVIGLPYDGDWISTQMAYGAGLGTAMNQPKRINRLGLNFVDTMLDGVRVASIKGDIDDGGFNTAQLAAKLKRVATVHKGKPLQPSQLFSEYHADMKAITNDWDTDSRIYMRARAPYPATTSGLVLQVKTNDTG